MRFLLPTAVILVAAPLMAQDAAPRVIVASPLGVVPGEAAKLTLRGLGLDTAESVRIDGVTVDVKLASKGEANVPGGLVAQKIGDTEAVVEFTLPVDYKPSEIALVVITPAGESRPYKLPVDALESIVREKEPNDGFNKPQAIASGRTVLGAIDQAKNVDVYRLEASAGERLTAEVFAGRRGSTLDAALELYDAAGQLLARDDDSAPGRDARLEVTLPAAGVYYLSLGDANDAGTPAHVYRLRIGLRTE